MELKNAKLVSSKRIDLPGQGEGWEVVLEIDWPFEDKPKGAPDRTLHVHHFPDSTLLWRAAEYGIDPGDVDTLLDVILNEMHIRAEDMDPTTTLAGGADTKTARDSHIRRCAQVKLRHRLSTRDNRSTLKANAANRFRESPVTAEEAEADHPLSPIRSHLAENPLNPKHLMECQLILARMKQEIK